jgi:hypothetical protein
LGGEGGGDLGCQGCGGGGYEELATAHGEGAWGALVYCGFLAGDRLGVMQRVER